jgi:SAM-dependent methyltransferase
MELTKTLKNYNQNASDYDRFRKPSSKIVEVLQNAFSGVDKILSIGCGTGQYSAAFRGGMNIVGLDMSMGMLSIAKKRMQDLACGDMLNLPFPNCVFDGIYYIQSFHHVGANLRISSSARERSRKQAISEAVRVLKRGPLVIVQRDPSQNQAVWFWEYFPKALETKLQIQPKISTIIKWLEENGLCNVEAVAIYDPMIQGFFEPTAPLNPGFRSSFSEFSYLAEQDMRDGVRKLQEAIENGTVFDKIAECRRKFDEIGGTVFSITAMKM